ncbi:hypothetical protein EZV62_004683 [Acer yangbiense]|uniref:SWIM-type domain-containing protein n=1 Tax=Acer yangbiense TaxID=1000413 RepID=A0A5C7IKL6_9ROSI|nr:hypothetical protein EZV62_004683 [Acer yangbiense]
MSEFRVHVKYVDRIVDMDLIEPGDCSVISLINDTKKQLNGCHIEAWETWQLRVTKHLTFIEFELLLVPIDIQFPEDAPTGLLGFNQQNIGDLVEENYEEDNFVLVEENFEEDDTVGDAATNGSDGSVVDNDYQVDEELEDDSDVSLMNENGENDKDHCEDGVTFIIGSVKGSHSICLRLVENKEATSRWVASILENFIRSNRNGKAKLFKDELQERFALKRYGNAILTMYPRSDVKVEMDPNVLDNPTFFRFYLSFDACKTGFVNGCRHLIAICICKSENSDSWSWFLKELRDSLGWDDRKKICFISDRQKGYVKALANKWPEAYTREYLTMNEKEARKLQVIHGRGNWYETVDNEGVKILVNLDDATCDYGMWQINRLPCTHAIAVFMYNREFHIIMYIGFTPSRHGN